MTFPAIKTIESVFSMLDIAIESAGEMSTDTKEALKAAKKNIVYEIKRET